jgi:two-component system, sensor histidine kinase PdtaS
VLLTRGSGCYSPEVRGFPRERGAVTTCGFVELDETLGNAMPGSARLVLKVVSEMAADAPPGAHRFERYQEILADFSRMVADSSDVSALLQLTAVQAARGIGIGHTKVLQHRPAFGDLLTVAGLGWRPGVVGHATFGADPGSVPGQTLQTRQPLIIYDMGSEPDLRNSAVLREHGIISLLNVPIAVDGIVWGVLEVDSDTPRHFGQSDALFLLTMANILGLSLHGRIALQRSRQEAIDAAGAVATQKTLLR